MGRSEVKCLWELLLFLKLLMSLTFFKVIIKTKAKPSEIPELNSGAMITRCPGSFCFIILYPQQLAASSWSKIDAQVLYIHQIPVLGKREGQRKVYPFLKYTTRVSHRASLIAQLVKNPPAMQETPVSFLGQEDPLEKG